MLTEEQNRQLTQVGSGTPMGELLRRHWHPIAGIDELERETIKPVRLLGEDLVLYKDLSGHYGLLERYCAHRGADLAYGFVEQEGLRCNYHGWQYGNGGQCVAQPYQDLVAPQGAMRDRIRLKAYEVRACAGLLWAYLGPQPAPQLPDWEPFHWRNGFVQVAFANVPCNWLQTQENSIDPLHFEWMHANWGRRLRGEQDYAPTHLKMAFEEFEHGFIYRRVTEDTDESHPLWTAGRVCLWPNGFFLGDHFEWRVPVDDENTLNVTWSYIRVPRESEPYVQESIPTWHAPVKDPRTGRWISSHVINQDIVAWCGQGRIADRTRENLAASDAGIVMVRRQYFRDMEAVAQGRDPKGVLREPAGAQGIPLPCGDWRDFFANSLPRSEYERHPKWSKLLHHFLFHPGQPEAVRRACEAATGVAMKDVDSAAVAV
ncbi:aromatic ring-hydroxylating dioxygenase subunit alpha [Paraburkholderia sp. MMS20-SJTN17]|uniref:Aromatic ring-hydroxylating dioxygenase subunit alpha n=1 Tax=Paraburkholderia translucens TaxID=2886945 RepID=A0ABS8KCW0_9BURK|nr:aromatic ring-hydroxylating dioxygenase subunit alpha [Paraburkholderia sp. MMS20-SJTN17]MCC8402323.1 aromatic ring-hydroxylating dioxygenase subunit alpha [Paraburkholderia sp. MMS20-SJTN17]